METTGEVRTGRRWFAVCEDMYDHPVVGAEVPPPKPADPSRHAKQPLAAWLWLLREAAWKARKVFLAGKEVIIERGEICHAERFMAEAWNWGRQAVRGFLSRLEAAGMLTRKTNPAGNPAPDIISICNYDKYQSAEESSNPTRNQAATQQQPSSNPKQYKDTNLKGAGSPGGSFWTQVLNPPRDVDFVGGKLTLHNGLHAEWLAAFDGDAKRLEFALGQAAAFVQPNGPHSLETQVNAQLCRIAGQKHDSDKRYAASKPQAGSLTAPASAKHARNLEAWKLIQARKEGK